MTIQSLESELASNAVESLRIGNLVEAERLCREVFATDASHPVACFVQGRLLDARGQKSEAIAFLRQALERDPSNSGLHHYLGVVLGSASESTPQRLPSLRQFASIQPIQRSVSALVGSCLPRTS